MAKKNDTPSAQTDLAVASSGTSGSAALAPSSSDALAGVMDGLELTTDGLEELGREDIKLSVKVWNFKGVDAAGDPIPANTFYDTVTEGIDKTLEATLLTLHKSNEWRSYDEAKGESVIHCRSYDQRTGTMADGVTRPCEGCPDAEWGMVDGKRKRNCGPVYNVVGLDRVTQSAMILRFKKTSLDPFKTYLNKHFIGRRVVSGKRGNYPLFAFVTKVTLKMSDDKKYAIPVFERGDVLTREDIESAMLDAQFYREHMMPALEKAERADASAGEDAGSFSFGANAAGANDRVFDTTGGDAGAAPNGF